MSCLIRSEIDFVYTYYVGKNLVEENSTWHQSYFVSVQSQSQRYLINYIGSLCVILFTKCFSVQ